ncbi:hypothetical protein NQ317_019547 [Molorchus minor]|uniref:C2H2-type domain-containing protein n=1 Tax=Molorchus minor TaxID=1323400 RepID=A0ABQ9J584_9CUCU|nr:hypothetical protein NQ317_019547 [Molorchus minor]
MELNCGEDIYYVERTNSLLDDEDGIDDYDDDLEAQVVDSHPLLDAFDIRIPQPQYVPKKKSPDSLHKLLNKFKSNGKSDSESSEDNYRSIIDQSYNVFQSHQIKMKEILPIEERCTKPKPKILRPEISLDGDSILMSEDHVGIGSGIQHKNDLNDSFSITNIDSYTMEDTEIGLKCKSGDDKLESPCILRSVNKSDTLVNKSNGSAVCISKYESLSLSPPHSIEISFSKNTTSVIFKNAEGQLIFPTHYIQLQRVQVQKLLRISQVQICKGLEQTIPQILTNLSAKIHLCPLKCTKAFLHIADAKIHTLKHMQVKPFKCDKPNCLWQFYTASRLTRHKETHKKKKDFICNINNCKKAFSTVYNLNEHKKKHNKPATLPCLVKECNAMFQNDYQRRLHYKIHDPKDAPFPCTNIKCTKSFFSQPLLDYHYRSCVQRESDIICPEPNCKKICASPYRLQEHMRQHTGVKPYQCSYKNCTWRFSTASKLKRHQIIHTRDRKFHCTIGDCKKSFFRSEHLKEHTLTHIEKKTFETEAIQSLGVPSDVMGNNLVQDDDIVLLDDEKFSTVNLRDLD